MNAELYWTPHKVCHRYLALLRAIKGREYAAASVVEYGMGWLWVKVPENPVTLLMSPDHIWELVRYYNTPERINDDPGWPSLLELRRKYYGGTILDMSGPFIGDGFSITFDPHGFKDIEQIHHD